MTVALPRPMSDEPALIARDAIRRADQDPEKALHGLQRAALLWVRQGEHRQAALALHRKAAITLQNGFSPIPDLAMAARLLEEIPEERALLLLDLGQALLQEGETERAALTLRASEKLSRQVGNFEMVAAARHALSRVAEERGNAVGAREYLRETGQAMSYHLESELLATLRDIGNLPNDPRAEQERLRRQEAVEEELAALKQSLGL